MASTSSSFSAHGLRHFIVARFRLIDGYRGREINKGYSNPRTSAQLGIGTPWFATQVGERSVTHTRRAAAFNTEAHPLHSAVMYIVCVVCGSNKWAGSAPTTDCASGRMWYICSRVMYVPFEATHLCCGTKPAVPTVHTSCQAGFFVPSFALPDHSFTLVYICVSNCSQYCFFGVRGSQ